ncbi:hypothetical protein AE956_21400 [Bacteroides fragilis]|nr:hypothetical protein [Bacteroides fragilis]
MLTSFRPNAYFFFGKRRLFSLPIKAIEEKKPGFSPPFARFCLHVSSGCSFSVKGTVSEKGFLLSF